MTTRTTEQRLGTLAVERQEAMLALHEAFWKRENRRALIGYAPVSRMFPLQNLKIEHEGRFGPEDVTEALMAADTGYRPGLLPDDELFPAKIPLEPLAWSEGYVGAGVYVSSRAQTVWSQQGERIPKTVGDLEGMVERGWREKLKRATAVNVAAAGDELLISEALLRGPADCLEAVMGAETLCYAMCDRPDEVSAMAEFMADRVMELYEGQFEVLGRFHGGTVNRYRLWGPGRNIVTQADIANVMSAEHFSKVFVPSYRRLARSFDIVTMHFHSSAYQHVDALLEIDELNAIEWALDPTGPGLAEMVKVFEKIQRAGKCVIVMNLKTDEEVRMLKTNLEPGGLCLIIRKAY